jgi:hypothetical protein
MNNDDKHNYWADQITKNQHKKHEIHAIISIKERLHQKLGDDFWNVRPQFQAYVLRPYAKDHKYALIDLYFPFCAVGIEIDEQQHESKRSKKADVERTLDLIQQLQASQRMKYKEIRIKPYIEKEFEQGVNKVVDLIVKEYESCEIKPVWNLDPFSFYKNRKEMSVADDVIFKNKQELIGVMLNIKDYHNHAPGYPKNKYPALAQNGYEFYVFNKNSLYVKKMKGKKKKGVEKYFNVFSEDFSEFRMYADRFGDPTKKDINEREMMRLAKRPKRVFGAKSKNGVVFCGVYEFDGMKKDPTPKYAYMPYYHKFKLISKSFLFDLCRKK